MHFPKLAKAYLYTLSLFFEKNLVSIQIYLIGSFQIDFYGKSSVKRYKI